MIELAFFKAEAYLLLLAHTPLDTSELHKGVEGEVEGGAMFLLAFMIAPYPRIAIICIFYRQSCLALKFLFVQT